LFCNVKKSHYFEKITKSIIPRCDSFKPASCLYQSKNDNACNISSGAYVPLHQP